jgi:hypothetical protein
METVTLTVKVQVPVDKWAEEYGLDPKAKSTREDIQEHVEKMVDEAMSMLPLAYLIDDWTVERGN